MFSRGKQIEGNLRKKYGRIPNTCTFDDVILIHVLSPFGTHYVSFNVIEKLFNFLFPSRSAVVPFCELDIPARIMFAIWLVSYLAHKMKNYRVC